VANQHASLLCVELQSLDDDARPHALFTMRWEENGPVAALIITPGVDGEPPNVVNLRTAPALQTDSL